MPVTFDLADDESDSPDDFTPAARTSFEPASAPSYAGVDYALAQRKPKRLPKFDTPDFDPRAAAEAYLAPDASEEHAKAQFYAERGFEPVVDAVGRVVPRGTKFGPDGRADLEHLGELDAGVNETPTVRAQMRLQQLQARNDAATAREQKRTDAINERLRQQTADAPRVMAAQAHAEAARSEAEARKHGAALKLFDKSPAGKELAALAETKGDDEKTAQERLGAFGAAIDFNRVTGDPSEAADKAQDNLARADALRQTRDRLAKAHDEATRRATVHTLRAQALADERDGITRQPDAPPPDLDASTRPDVHLAEIPETDAEGRQTVDSLVRMKNKATELQATLDGAGGNLAAPVRARLKAQISALNSASEQGVNDQTDEGRKAVSDQTRAPSMFDVASGAVKSLADSAAQGGSAVLKGAQLVSDALPAPARDEFGVRDPQAAAENARRATLTPSQKLDESLSGPAYQLGSLISDSASEFYAKSKHEDAGTISKGINAAAEAAGGFAPLLASGPLAPVAMGLQTAGNDVENIYRKMVARGTTPDGAADFAVKRALASGAVQAAIFEFLPKPLAGAVNKGIADRIAKGALTKFLTNRLAQGAEGAVLGAGSKLASNATTGEPLTEGVTESAAGLALAQGVMPRGALPVKTEGEVPPASETPPESPNEPTPPTVPLAPMPPAIDKPARITEMLAQGHTPAEVAAEVGVPLADVHDVRDARGIPSADDPAALEAWKLANEDSASRNEPNAVRSEENDQGAGRPTDSAQPKENARDVATAPIAEEVAQNGEVAPTQLQSPPEAVESDVTPTEVPTAEAAAAPVVSTGDAEAAIARGEYQPAIKLADGDIVNGSHQVVLDDLRRQRIETSGAQRGFVTPDGKFLGLMDVARREMAKKSAPVEPVATGDRGTPEEQAARNTARPAERQRLVDEHLAAGQTSGNELGENVQQAGPSPDRPVRAPIGEITGEKNGSESKENPEQIRPIRDSGGLNSNTDSGTGIKNASVAEIRKKLGLPETDERHGLKTADAHEQALAIVKADPKAGARLADELERTGRAATGVEDLVLAHELTNIRKERSAAETEFDAATQSGDPVAIEAAQTRINDARDAFNKVGAVADATGTAQSDALRLRGAMLKEDFSIANLERRIGRARGNKELSDEEKKADAALAKKFHDDYDKTLKEKDAAIASRDLKIAEQDTDLALFKITNRVSQERKNPPKSWKPVLDTIIDRGEAAKQRLIAKMRSGQVRSSIAGGLEDAHEYAQVVAGYIAKGIKGAHELSSRLISDFGETIRPHIPTLLKLGTEEHEKNVRAMTATGRDTMSERESTVAAMKARVAAGESISDLTPFVQRIAEQHLREGVKFRQGLWQAVHRTLREVDPNITPLETLHALSGYGKQSKLNPEAVKAQLRDLRAQLQKVAQVQDLLAKKAPLKTGMERGEPSDEVRRLQQQVKELQRKGGYAVTDPAAQLRAPLDEVKKRLTNQIKDLDFQISTGKKIVREKTAMPADAETAILTQQRDALRKRFDEIFTRPELTREQRIARADKYLEGQINNLGAQLRTGTVFGGGKPEQISTPTLDAKRAQIAALKEQREYMRMSLQPSADPLTGDALRLQALKTRLAEHTAELQDKIAKGDFAKSAPRPPIDLDAEAQKLTAAHERVKQDFENKRFEVEQAQRPRWEKVLEQISGGARASALSGYHTLIKLAAYSATKFAGIPVTELTATALSKVPGLRRTFAMSPHEGGATVDTLGTLYHSAATKGLTEAARVMRTGKTDAKAVYGKQKPEAQHWYDFPGKLHGAEKAPLITGVHEMLVKKATAKAKAAGVDVNDEMVKGAIRKDAFDYANRSILQENNKFSNWINDGLAKMRAVDKESGKASGTKAVIATALETLLTKGIVKTPANYFMQSLEASPIGFATGVAKQAVALRRGVQNLTPKEADTIARLLSVGAVGSGLFVLGAIDATKKEKDRMFGGYYQPGDKRGPTDASFGSIRIGDTHLPHLVTHNPFTESAQMGSTFMRVMLSKLKKSDVENRGALAGALSSILGLAEGAPIENQMLRLNKLTDPHQQVNVVGGIVRGLVPQLVANIAEDTDSKKRAPTTVGENVEMAVPGLRQQVPVAKPKK